MRYFKVMLIFCSIAMLLPACNSVESCSVSTSAGYVPVDCDSFSNSAREILTEEDFRELQNNLNTHRQLWESNNVNHYCFSDFRQIPTTINYFETIQSVSNNRVYQAVLVTNGLSELDLWLITNVPQYSAENGGKTIEDVFNNIQGNINFFKLHYSGGISEELYNSGLPAIYDQRYGYPIMHASYVSTITGGGGTSYSISNFQIKN